MLLCFKQKTAYEMRISDWSSDVCSSDLRACDAAREEVAIDREGGARGNFRGVGLAHDDRAERPHLAVEQTDGIAVSIVAAAAVRADHLGERFALLRGRPVAAAAHFAAAHAIPPPGQLPSPSGPPDP